MHKLFIFIIASLLSSAVRAQLSAPLSFMTKSEPISAIITDYAYKDTIPSPSALVRLPNGKVAYMVKEKGVMAPFYIKAIETGYWDTRYEADTNYDTIFADMHDMGANTAYVMLHWEDIETSDNHFDFSFPDAVAAAASRQNLKVKWILFLHAQTNGVPSHHAETAWTFHLDDRDSCNYTMQWPKRNGEIYRTISELTSKGGIRPLHVYGHPEIFYRIRRMLYQLAVHYRNDSSVIGVQLGNEEGFSFLDDSDYNPITAALYEEWKLKTNKTDYAQFKKEAINWWWKQFTSAYHEGDPYKILSFNLDAAQAEGEDMQRIEVSGTSAATYGDGNLDAIGTMLYKGWGYKALLGLDKRYNEGSYNYSLPILIPSEIGIGNFNTPHDFRSFVLHSLERGAQGFGVYCYGEVRKELPDSINARKDMVELFANIRANEELVYAGLPGPGYMQCHTENKAFHISHLNVDDKETLAMVFNFTHQPGGVDTYNNDIAFPLYFKASQSGSYIISIYKQGKLLSTEKCNAKESEVIHLTVPMQEDDILFIRMTKEPSTVPVL